MCNGFSGTFDRQSICNTLQDSVCGNGKCVPNDLDVGYYCVCNEGAWINKDTGKCKGKNRIVV